MTNRKQPSWLKYRGYLHLTPQIDVITRFKELNAKVRNNNYVSHYAFFPLIHSVIKERKYKRLKKDLPKRSHKREKDGQVVSSAKRRPLHYATHMDAIIFAYYAELLQERYEKELLKHENLSETIIAYRKIPKTPETNKSTIDFAKEVFDEIKRRADNDCLVLMFDIENFFSTLNHELLKRAWIKLVEDECIGLKEGELPKHHYNVFKAATRFSYILLDDLRIIKNKHSKRSGFDEKKLAAIRKKGIQAFFESPQDLRNAIKNKEIKIHKYPFKDKQGNIYGIPQGLPISAVLANLYLLDFDIQVVERIVSGLGCYYRRYSDDIIIICKPGQETDIENIIKEEIECRKLNISLDKTEKFYFKRRPISPNEVHLSSNKICENVCKISVPLTYLGFEFHGYKTLVKSSNLAKFYRRMIFAVKRKSKIAIKEAAKIPGSKPLIYKRQLYRLYTIKDLNKKKIYNKVKKLVKGDNGEYVMKLTINHKKLKSNYLSYIRRAGETMEEKAISQQIENHRKIFYQAIQKHFTKRIGS